MNTITKAENVEVDKAMILLIEKYHHLREELRRLTEESMETQKRIRQTRGAIHLLMGDRDSFSNDGLRVEVICGQLWIAPREETVNE